MTNAGVDEWEGGNHSGWRRRRGVKASMCMRFHSCRFVLLSGLFLFACFPSAAQADQIVLVVDEHGNKIYVNTAETNTRVDWMARSFHPVPAAASNRSSAEIDTLLEQTASRHQVDPGLVRAIVRVESDFDPKAVSRKGAMGLMQLIPATAQRFGVANPFDPSQNLEGGVNYLKYLLDTFRGDLSLSLAAYNAGEHTVQRSGGIPAIIETQNYVRKVTNLYQVDGPRPVKATFREPLKVPIARYVDSYGVVHFTNVE